MGECDLIATVQPEDASNKSLLWASTNEDVASVDNMGHVSLLKEGTATIIVSSTDGSNLSAKCEVTVAKRVIPVASLSLDHTRIFGYELEEWDLVATVQPEDASNKGLLWASTNEDVASVDNMGHVRLLKEGTATIIVSSTDGSNLSAKCEVMVLPPTGIEDIKANPEAYVRVYNMSGVLMYEGLYSRMNLNAGYYVIQYNGSSFVHRIK